MAVNAQREIHYISELKKYFCGRNQQPITQKFKIDTNISDDYYFQIISRNNQIVSLADRAFKIYGSYIDAKRQIHILFFTDSYSIEDNVLHFHLNTNTNEYNEYIDTEYKEINLTIIETTGGNTQVTLRDVALAYRRPYIEGDTPVQIVYRDILTGINVPLTGSFGVGTNISLIPGTNSFAFGEGLITTNENQTVLGQYNTPDAEQAFIIANGLDSNNRNNLFTISFDGTAYLSGVRILTANDRVNVSELNNDIGYITLADVPVYEAGTGLKKQNNTFSLTAVVPSAVSQLTNDTGFITGYNAGSGISIVDGTINCTVSGGGGGGATYTAGAGIGISDQNVISLTATIPTTVAQLTDASNYATTSWVEGKNYLTAVPNTYALKTDIPSTVYDKLSAGTSITLSKDDATGITTINSSGGSLIAGNRIKLTETAQGTRIDVLNKITASDQTFTFDMRKGTTTSSLVYTYDGSESVSVAFDPSLPNGVTYSNGVFTATSAANVANGSTTVSAIMTASDAEETDIQTTFNIIGVVDAAFTGSDQTMDLDFSAQSSYLSSFTYTYTGDEDSSIQVSYSNIPSGVTATSSYSNGTVTITLSGSDQTVTESQTTTGSIKLIANDTVETTFTIGFTIKLDQRKVPLTFKAVNGPAGIKMNMFGSSSYNASFKYNKEKEGWKPWLLGVEYIVLDEGQSVEISGANTQLTDGGSVWYRFEMVGQVEAEGNVMSIMNFSDTCTACCFQSLFAGCTGLLKAPGLYATTLAQDCYQWMFQNCSNLSSITVAFTDWSSCDGWVDGVDGYVYSGTFTKPSALSESYGSSYIPNGWTVINV